MGLRAVALLIGAFVVLGTGAALLAPARGEDPAILVCEAGLKFQLEDGMVYRRVAAAVEGSMAKIDYEMQFKKDQPERVSYECEFEYAKETDVFQIKMPVDATCNSFLNNTKTIETELERKMLNACDRLITLLTKNKDRIERANRGLGIYPIKASATALAKN